MRLVGKVAGLTQGSSFRQSAQVENAIIYTSWQDSHGRNSEKLRYGESSSTPGSRDLSIKSEFPGHSTESTSCHFPHPWVAASLAPTGHKGLTPNLQP